MTQLEMPYPDTPGFKTAGPSQEAADSMKGRASYLREKCLQALQRYGAMTADECAGRLRESVLSIRPRFTELRALHQIYDTGVRRKNDSGRNATVWAAGEGM